MQSSPEDVNLKDDESRDLIHKQCEQIQHLQTKLASTEEQLVKTSNELRREKAGWRASNAWKRDRDHEKLLRDFAKQTNELNDTKKLVNELKSDVQITKIQEQTAEMKKTHTLELQRLRTDNTDLRKQIRRLETPNQTKKRRRKAFKKAQSIQKSAKSVNRFLHKNVKSDEEEIFENVENILTIARKLIKQNNPDDE